VLQTGSWFSPRPSILPQKGKEGRESRESKKLEISLAPFFGLLHWILIILLPTTSCEMGADRSSEVLPFLGKTGIQASDAPITFFGI
jgi:hypothetical protein